MRNRNERAWELIAYAVSFAIVLTAGKALYVFIKQFLGGD